MNWNESAWLTAMTGVALKSTGVLCAAWTLAFLLRRKSAAARHLVWTAAASAMLTLPFLTLSLPELPASLPAGALAGVGVVFQTVVSPGTHGSVAAPPAEEGQKRVPPMSWRPDWTLGLML